jgi:4-hydroxythreonine-4-phosphate dehydrogenase
VKKFVFTCGDINGIGPEIVIKTLNKISKSLSEQIFFICPANVFLEAYHLVNAEFRYIIEKSFPQLNEPAIVIIDAGKVKTKPGYPTSKSGNTAFKAISFGFKLANEKKVDALITAPISKSALKLAGINFPGHTEMLAEWSGTKKYVMMFLSEKMNAALLTIHQPLKKVSGLITKKRIASAIKIIHNTLKVDLNITNPRIAVLGFNPHAGEEGIIGKEEKKVIKPALEKLKSEYNISGPFPADGFFGSKNFIYYDIVLGMYHDQVLVPFKIFNFSTGVNYTAGLPIVRISPDHGTAYDVAWQNKADESSIYEAYKYAGMISDNRNKNGLH